MPSCIFHFFQGILTNKLELRKIVQAVRSQGLEFKCLFYHPGPCADICP